MTVRVTCQCGATYDLKDQFAGKLVRCPQCGGENRVSATPGDIRPQVDPALDRDIFLLRQQMLKISEKYDVGDEEGKKIIFVERPAHLLRNLAALLAAAIVFVAIVGAFIALADASQGSALEAVFIIMGVVGALVGAVATGVALSVKRHVSFYRDATKRELLLDVLQDRKWQPVTATYTVRDARGQPLARLAKNYLYNMLRKRWYVYAPDGSLAYMAKEDSIILSLLRRLLGSFFGLLRTNFVIFRGASEEIVGEFKRKFTILDRYVLDMTADSGRTMDRRLALALGVMLDTGERR